MSRFLWKKKKLTAAWLLACVIICSLLPTTKSYAHDVTDVTAKMYTTSGTPVYAAADLTSGVVVYLERFTIVSVTGITDNGFYQIDLNGAYYIPGPYLVTSVATAKTDKQKALEQLETFATAYQNLLEQMESYSSAFALLDVTGDGVPELFDLNGQEIYTYYDGRAVMLYYSETPLTFYYDKKDNRLLGRYTWNGSQIWEVYTLDKSLLAWGQLKCYTTNASAYKGSATAVSHAYTNDADTRAAMYDTLKGLLNL